MNEEGELHNYLSKVQPPQPDKFSGGTRDVAAFIRSVERYFQLAPHIPTDKQAIWATSWLRDEPLRIWEAEMQVKADANQTCSLKDFKDFLLKHYDNLLPARQFKQQFRELKQTGSVSEYTRSMKRLIYELKGTPMEVSPGDIVDRYIEGLKPAARKYVQTNAPENWWTDPDQLFSKALHYEINISAATTSDAPAQFNSQLPQPPHGAPSTAGRGFGGGRGRRGGFTGRGNRAPRGGGGFRGRGRGTGRYSPYSRPTPSQGLPILSSRTSLTSLQTLLLACHPSVALVTLLTLVTLLQSPGQCIE
jgi:hypothetical protein